MTKTHKPIHVPKKYNLRRVGRETRDSLVLWDKKVGSGAPGSGKGGKPTNLLSLLHSSA